MRTLVLLGVVAAVAAGRAAAQLPSDAPPPVLRAARASGAIRLDGLPDEPAWLLADSLADFTQKDPAEGAAPTQRTVIRVLAGQGGLYVAAWMYEERPGQLVRAHVRRDDDLESDDYIVLLLDPQRDRRSGYVFGTNPNGMIWDGEVVNAENLNTDWNGVWDVRARVTSFGWTAEFFIPWQNLRYRSDVTTFGFNVERLMRRTNEKVLWRSWLRQQGLLFQETEGMLELPDVLPGRQAFEGRPYVLGRADAASRQFDSTGTDSVVADAAASGKAGFDGKLAVAPTMTLDVTVNTDFAQVDADRQVVNLTRFPVFFPEKRQFFLESAATFDLGQSERTQLFHSRRIGLDSVGNVVPIVAGARLTGRAGRERLGLLAVRTGGGEDAFDGVARIQHDVLSRGYVGLEGTYQGGPGIQGERWGGGVDVAVPLLLDGQNLVPQAFAAVTRNADGSSWASAWRLFLDYPNDWADNFLAVSRIEDGFDPSLGFVLQSGVQRQTGAVRIYPRPHRWGIRRLQVMQFEFEVNEKLDGALDHAIYSLVPLGAEFESGDEVSFSVRHNDDVLPDTFDVFPGVLIPPGRYGWNRGSLSFSSSPARALVAEFGVSTGGFYSGNSQTFEYDVSVRFEPHLIAGVNGGWERVGLPSGEFTAQVHRLRLDYATNPRLNTTLFLQWDNESKRLAVNARLHWIPRPGSDAYLVWNTAWPTGLTGGNSVPWDRPLSGALVGKFVYYFRW